MRVVATIGEEDSIARRLHDLGIRTGIEIEVIRRAPLGDPTVFELCGYQLCLRRSESARVEVVTAAAIRPLARDERDARRISDGRDGRDARDARDARDGRDAPDAADAPELLGAGTAGNAR